MNIRLEEHNRNLVNYNGLTPIQVEWNAARSRGEDTYCETRTCKHCGKHQKTTR